ncbi:hypothetical protein EK904_006289 [Melospiza melodia maxima]|nr:hypothetical protein EK904_006289 [Melospiza melodia maxima]
MSRGNASSANRMWERRVMAETFSCLQGEKPKACLSVRAQSHLAGLEEKGTEWSKHGGEAGGAGPASPRSHPALGAIPEPGLSRGSDCSTQTVHPHSFVVGERAVALSSVGHTSSCTSSPCRAPATPATAAHAAIQLKRQERQTDQAHNLQAQFTWAFWGQRGTVTQHQHTHSTAYKN